MLKLSNSFMTCQHKQVAWDYGIKWHQMSPVSHLLTGIKKSAVSEFFNTFLAFNTNTSYKQKKQSHYISNYKILLIYLDFYHLQIKVPAIWTNWYKAFYSFTF